MTEVKPPKTRPLPMARINTRVRKQQQKFIKARAKKTNRTEGEVFRAMIDREMVLEANKLKK